MKAFYIIIISVVFRASAIDIASFFYWAVSGLKNLVMRTVGGVMRARRGTFQKRFSGIRPLRGYPPPLNGRIPLKRF